MKRTIHFVYSVPHAPNRTERLWLRLLKQTHRGAGDNWQPWRGGDIYYRPVTLHSPASITVHLAHHLKRRFRVRLYDWDEAGVNPRFDAEDIVLGHVHPGGDRPMNNMLYSDAPAAAKILLMPFHHALPDTDALVDYARRCDAYAAICGPYWIDTIECSKFRGLSQKFRRIDMAIDARQYPMLKHAFNAKGKRRFLYIGHNRSANKGCRHLSRLALQCPEHEFGWIGEGEEIPGVHRLSSGRGLVPSYMAEICEQYDFFITMGVSDANPTTILEAMAWGLPVLCTPQSGYYKMPTIFNLSLDDDEFNTEMLKQLQSMEEHELRSIARHNREMVVRDYTWDTFCTRVDEVIDEHVDRQAARSKVEG